jgi:hypothetical protein
VPDREGTVGELADRIYRRPNSHGVVKARYKSGTIFRDSSDGRRYIVQEDGSWRREDGDV